MASEKKFLSKKFLAHASQGGVSTGKQTIDDQTLTKCNKNDQIHVDFFQEHQFLESKKTTQRILLEWDGGRGPSDIGGG